MGFHPLSKLSAIYWRYAF